MKIENKDHSVIKVKEKTGFWNKFKKWIQGIFSSRSVTIKNVSNSKIDINIK